MLFRNKDHGPLNVQLKLYNIRIEDTLNNIIKQLKNILTTSVCYFPTGLALGINV